VGHAGAVLLAVALAAPSPATTADPPPASFDEVARRASVAREAGRLDEAARLYREGLKLRPAWAEGLGFLGSIAYDQDRYVECRDAFRRLVALDPKAGPAWALRGLCEFRLRAYTASRQHLDRALALGRLPGEALERVVLYHQALLRLRAGEFELAIAPLTTLLRSQPETPELTRACGLLLLRRAQLPDTVPPADRPLVDEAGGAYCAHLARHSGEARARYEALLARHSRERHLHYGYGLALAQSGSAEAITQFRREIELHPDDVLARLELAFALLARGRAKEAVPVAEEAVRLAPGLFATHTALGRALVEVDEVGRGIEELERAAKLEPDVPEAYMFLARAYAKAGRTNDAEKAQSVFKVLDDARRRAAETAAGAGAPPR
jgi:tetratricopeptide (TPR) repeat protein